MKKLQCFQKSAHNEGNNPVVLTSLTYYGKVQLGVSSGTVRPYREHLVCFLKMTNCDFPLRCRADKIGLAAASTQTVHDYEPSSTLLDFNGYRKWYIKVNKPLCHVLTSITLILFSFEDDYSRQYVRTYRMSFWFFLDSEQNRFR